MKRSVAPNKHYYFRTKELDLTSQGSPENTEASVFATTVHKGKVVQVKMGEFPVEDGVAKVNFRTPRIRFSQLSVVAEPSRDDRGHLPRLIGASGSRQSRASTPARRPSRPSRGRPARS